MSKKAKRDGKYIHHTAVREDGTYDSEKNPEYDYVLRYIAEAIDYRAKKVGLTARAIEAYKGFPSQDGYIGGIDAYASMWDRIDKDKADAIRARCKAVRPQKNMIIMRAIDSMVAQAQGGVGQFECEVYDPNFKKSAELVDKLDALAMDFYRRNHIDSQLSTALEYAGLSGAVYSFLEYDTKRSVNQGKITHSLIPDTEMLIDPVGSKRNHARYIGHQNKDVSWADLKQHLVKCDYCDAYMLKSINEVDAMLSEVEYWINKYNGDFSAIMPAITGDGTLYGTGIYTENLPHMIDDFYRAGALAWRERNSKYDQTKGGASEQGADDGKYHARNVEVTYLTDLENDIQFTVVNRKYIVSVKHKPFHAKLPYNYFVIDPVSGKAIDLEGEKDIMIDHPYVPLTYKKSMWETYPYSPIIHVLDLFDQLCALETMVYHTISVMTPLTFTGNPKDIEKLGSIAGISGEAIKGFIGNSVSVVNKSVDLSPALSEISRLESTIMKILNGMDSEQQSKIVGDRATAAEAMSAASLASQGLNALLANIEGWAEELATKMFKFTVVSEPEDFMYDLSVNGKHVVLTREDIAGDMGIHAVLHSRIKAEQQAQAAMTMQWFVPLFGSEVIVNKEAFAQSIVPTLAEGFTRKTIASWFIPTEEQKQQQEIMLQQQKAQAEAMEAQAKKEKGIDFSYVDPSSNGRFGQADIARVLSGGAQLPSGPAVEQYAYEQANAQAGNAQVSGNQEAEVVGGYDSMASEAGQEKEAVDPKAEESEAGALQELLEIIQTPTSGGISSNYGMNAGRLDPYAAQQSAGGTTTGDAYNRSMNR